jgi:histidinol phosphatase-like enzyme
MPGLYSHDERGKLRYNLELQKASHEWCQKEAEAAMQRGESPIAIANTSMQRRWYQVYINLFLEYGYSVQIVTCEGIILPDGSPAVSTHDVALNISDRMRVGYEPYVYQPFFWENVTNPHVSSVLRLWDKDGTLVFNPNGGIPELDRQKPIFGVGEKLRQFKESGDIIVVASNQAGLATTNKETGAFLKTFGSLEQEALELMDMFPEIDLFLACPDWEGNACLVLEKGSQRLVTLERSGTLEPFRKPQPGMLQYAMNRYARKFSQTIFYGTGQVDYLTALAANVPYCHVHDLLYP